jgi:hypothetical protein
MYAAEARAYIEKLIRLNKKMYEKGYRRQDQGAVNQARKHLKNQLEFYPYDTEIKMKVFWRLNYGKIRLLIPSESHRCFKKLMNEFITLQNQ